MERSGCDNIYRLSLIHILTTLGMKEEDMEVIAEAISLVIKDEANVEKAKALVAGLTEKYPLI